VIKLFPKYGHLILSGSADTKVKIWDVHNARNCKRTYMGHTGGVKDVEFTNDGLKFLSCSFDRRTKLWDTETGACLGDYTNGKMANCAKFYPLDQNVFLLGSSSNSIVQVGGWVVLGRAGWVVVGPSPAVCMHVGVTIGVKELHGAEWDGGWGTGGAVVRGGTVVTWLSSGRVFCACLMCAHGACVAGVVVFVGFQWDIRTNTIVQEYQYHLAPVNTVTFADEGRRFVSTSVRGPRKCHPCVPHPSAPSAAHAHLPPLAHMCLSVCVGAIVIVVLLVGLCGGID
jgi:hypothetical protein